MVAYVKPEDLKKFGYPEQSSLKSNWISANEPPKIEGQYFISIKGKKPFRIYTTAYFKFLTGNKYSHEWDMDRCYSDYDYIVTHWMEIEKLPEND